MVDKRNSVQSNDSTKGWFTKNLTASSISPVRKTKEEMQNELKRFHARVKMDKRKVYEVARQSKEYIEKHKKQWEEYHDFLRSDDQL